MTEYLVSLKISDKLNGVEEITSYMWKCNKMTWEELGLVKSKAEESLCDTKRYDIRVLSFSKIDSEDEY